MRLWPDYTMLAVFFFQTWLCLYVWMHYALIPWYQRRVMGTYTDLNQKGEDNQ